MTSNRNCRLKQIVSHGLNENGTGIDITNWHIVIHIIKLRIQLLFVSLLTCYGAYLIL